MMPYPSFSDLRHLGMTYSIDGISVPRDYFISTVEAHFHGSLGFALLEQSARTQTYRWVQGGTLTITDHRGAKNPDTDVVIGTTVTIPFGYWQPTSLSDTTSLSLLFAGIDLPQNTAQLSSTGQQIFDNARNNLLKELTGMDDASKCAKFLSKVGGIGAVAASIRAMQPYDGRESNITYKEAGVIDYGNPEVQGLNPSARAEIENKLVSAFFQNGLYFGGAMSGSNNRVFFGPFPIKNTEGYVAATILHESLHTLTGYGDERLATLLFGKKFTNNEKASAAISKGLKDNGCVKRR
jgi:hypothetical protein